MSDRNSILEEVVQRLQYEDMRTSANIVLAMKDAAPTQGADARPIYQVEQVPGRWTNVSRETFDAWAFGKQIVYAPRDATPVVDARPVVSYIPDHCDRIVWRDNYYHLPLKE